MEDLDLLRNIEYILVDNKLKYTKNMVCIENKNLKLSNNDVFISQEYSHEVEEDILYGSKD